MRKKIMKKEKKMKRKKSIGLIIMAAIMSLCTVVGVQGIQNIQASAATIYTSSEKDYWEITAGSGDYTVSLDNSAVTWSAYKGVETVVTPAEGVEDIGITLKGMVYPMQKLLLFHDNYVNEELEADAIVYSFTSLSDPDRQISVIATQRDNSCWYTLALTDELEVRDGYTYIKGTDQLTMGLPDLNYSDSYGETGYTKRDAWGANYQGEVVFHIGEDGGIYYTDSLVIGNVANENFLSTSKANLAGTEYEARYTSEYVTETLTQLASGARMEIKWYGVKTETLDFHIRGINGSWIGDDGGRGLEYNLGVMHSTIIYKKVNTLYVGETYKLSDLLYGGGYTFRNAENSSAPLKLSGWYAKDVNLTAGTEDTSTWYNALTQMDKTITLNTPGTYSMTMSGSFLGYYHSRNFPTEFTFEVVATLPTVTAQENVKMIGKQSYDLTSYFTFDNADDATITYVMDGEEITEPTAYIADGKDHEIVCTATTAYGSASATLNVTGIWVGDTFFTSSNGTVDYFTQKSSNAENGNTGVRTEISNVTEENVTITYNQTLSAGLGSGDMFTFDKYTNTSGEAIAVADMIVITYTSLVDPTKQLSVVNYINGDNIGCTVVAFTNDLEYKNNSVYIKGTNQNVVGLRYSTYNLIGYADGEDPVLGATYFYIDIESDGSIRHTASAVYANILNEDYLSASRANMDANNPYYNRYTSEYAQEILTAITTDKCMLTISYYGLNEERSENTLGFNIPQLNNQWLGATAKTFTLTYPFIYPKTTTLYAENSYTIAELVNVYSTYRVDGEITAAMEGYTDANNQSADTYVNKNTVFTKNFTPTSAGTWSIYVTTRFAPSGQSWSDRYLTQTVTFDVAYRLNIEIAGETTVKDVTTSSYVLPEVNVTDKVFLGWEYDGELYPAGSAIAITEHDTTLVAKAMSFETPDFAAARISTQSGLRFTTYMDKAGFEGLEGVEYSFYTLITSKNSTKSVKIDIDSEKIYFNEEVGQYCFLSALVDILPQNYTRVYYAESYMVITYADGSTKTLKVETLANREGRSYAYVIEAAANDYQDTYDEKDYPYAVTVNGETMYAPVPAETFNAINEINNTIKETAVTPYVSIEFNGENVTTDYKAQIKEYFQSNPAVIGDDIDASDMVQQLFGDGYAIDYQNSVYSGTVTTRGLDLTLYIVEDYFVLEGVSEYSIVYANDLDAYAANEIQYFINEVAGIELPVIADDGSVDSNAKVISLGQTAYQQAADLSDVDYNDLKTDGFIIKRNFNNYIIDSATPDGIVYGAYHFVNKMLGVEFLTSKATYIPQATTIKAKMLNVVEIPDFAIRDYYAYEVWQWASSSAKFAMNSSSLLTDSRISGNNYNYDYYGYYYGEEQASKYGGQVMTPAATREGHTVQYMLMADAYLKGFTSSYSETNNDYFSSTTGVSDDWPTGYYNENPDWYAWDPNYRNRVNTKYGSDTVNNGNVRVNYKGYSQEEICWTNGLTKNADGSLSYVAGSTDAQGSVIEKLVEICIAMIDDERNANSKYIMLGFADYYCECQCGSTQDLYYRGTTKLGSQTKEGNCTHGYSYYGGFGGVVANTVNEIAKAVKAQRPDSNAVFVTFAYSKGIEVPTNLSLREDVAVKMAYGNCVSHALTDTSCTHNDIALERINGWKEVLHENGEMLIWDYTVNFTDYLYYLPNFDAMKTNYQYYRDTLNTQHILSQGCPGEYNFYEHQLHLYVSTKLMWNADLDVSSIITKFDTLYFGNYASYVAEYRDIMEAMYTEKAIHATTDDALNYKEASTYDKTALLNACNKIQAAIDAVEADDTLTDEEKTTLTTRLRSVKITPQYMLLDLGLSTDSDLASDFFTSIELLGITTRNHSGATFADMKADFGL